MSDETYLGHFEPRKNVKLLLLHPVASRKGVEGPIPLKLDNLLSPDTQIDEVFCPDAPLSFDEDPGQARQYAPLVVEKARWAEAQGYDAVVINCMLDPGLQEAKSAVSIPVIGLKEASTMIALLVGSRPGYIFPGDIGVLGFTDNEERTFDSLLARGRDKINYQGTDVLIPNCAYLGGFAGRLQEELGVPVLANRDIAIKVGELVVTFGLKPEERWVQGNRSKTKMFLTRLYQTPVVGPILYRTLQLLRRSS